MTGAMPGYRVIARNTAAHGENPIHDDDVAREHGFRGGLVPGVTVYAYLTHSLVEAWGEEWLSRGTASVRFVKPVLEGESVEISGSEEGSAGRGLSATLTATTPAGGVCASLTATLPAGGTETVDPAAYAAAPLPGERPQATREHLGSLGTLGTPVAVYDAATAASYADSVSDALGLYRGAGGAVHPAFYLDQANRALDRNVRMGPWIHVASVIRHLGRARLGDRLETRGRVRALFEKKRRELAELDLLIVAGDPPRPVAHVIHTAIYRLPPPVPA